MSKHETRIFADAGTWVCRCSCGWVEKGVVGIDAAMGATDEHRKEQA